MHPAGRYPLRPLHPVEPVQETDSTESCSSDDEQDQAGADRDSAVSHLARAFMAWDARLVGPGLLACAAHPGACAFAAFLLDLEVQARPRHDLRREVLQWLRELGRDAGRRERALDAVGENRGAMPAMALYRSMRPVD